MDFILFIVFLYVFGIFAIALRSERFVQEKIFILKEIFKNESYKGIN